MFDKLVNRRFSLVSPFDVFLTSKCYYPDNKCSISPCESKKAIEVHAVRSEKIVSRPTTQFC